jgi:hypothetical protein
MLKKNEKSISILTEGDKNSYFLTQNLFIVCFYFAYVDKMNIISAFRANRNLLIRIKEQNNPTLRRS